MKRLIVALGAVALSCSVVAASDPIAARKEMCNEFGKKFGAIKELLETTDASEQAELLGRANALDETTQSHWNRKEEYFPAGSHAGDTRALPSIWEKADEFQASIDRQKSATAALVTAVQSADLAQRKSAFSRVGSSCGGCHESFRKR